MPEYLAPGVFIEETSFRSKSIEGVSTSVTGFVGSTRYGPVDLVGELLTSLGEFERAYGDQQQLHVGGSTRHNYLWHAARAFFEEGGKRLHVSRVFRRIDDSPGRPAPYLGPDETCTQIPYADGHSRARLGAGGPNQGGGLEVWARYPGLAGNVRVRFTFTAGPNVLVVRTVIGVDRRGDGSRRRSSRRRACNRRTSSSCRAVPRRLAGERRKGRSTSHPRKLAGTGPSRTTRAILEGHSCSVRSPRPKRGRGSRSGSSR